MIIGIGTDICDIRRIEESIDKFGVRFLNRVFTSNEQEYCESKARPAMSFGKRFAAKEAVAKALAGADTGSLAWTSVEILNDPSGRPVVTLLKDARERSVSRCPNGHKVSIHVSCDCRSHSKR